MVSRRAHIPGASMAPQYRCLHCTSERWQAGGASTLDRHLRDVHGIDTGGFPATICVSDGHEVDWEGCPVMDRVGGVNRRRPADTEGLDGWIRTAPAKTNIHNIGPNP